MQKERIMHISWHIMTNNNNIIINNINNYDNLYGTITHPYQYKGTSQTTKRDKP